MNRKGLRAIPNSSPNYNIFINENLTFKTIRWLFFIMNLNARVILRKPI